MAFSDVLGQERAKRFLRRLLDLEKIPHAILLSGMEGVGKAALAREFARLLNCLNPQHGDSCARCASCLKMRDGHHPDLVWVKSEGTSIKLDQIRDLKQRLAFRPFEGKWRVVVIEDAHELREEAGNSLLKLLEEPPKQNLFLLTTLEPQMLLPTIVSRCCHVRLQPLEESWIERYLTEKHGLVPTQAQQLAALAEGSLARARELAEPDRIEHMNGVLENVSRLNGLPMVDFFPLTAQWAKETEGLEQDLGCIKLWIRDLILSRLLAGHRPVLRSDERTMKRAQQAGVEKLLCLFTDIENAQRLIRQNANKQLTLEGVCLAIKEKLYGESGWNSISSGRESLSF
jgi:DNA polymerase III subunit delta'